MSNDYEKDWLLDVQESVGFRTVVVPEGIQSSDINTVVSATDNDVIVNLLEAPEVLTLTLGEQGPPGTSIPGTGDKHYLFVQGVPSTLWTITHNLGKYPAVSVVDSSGTEIGGLVEYLDINTLTITFAYAFSGTAYCN